MRPGPAPSKLQSRLTSHTQAMATKEAPARERKRPREGDTATSPAAAAVERQYTYWPIADALKEDPGVRVCLFAVVTQIGPARRSRGTGHPHAQVSTPPLLSFHAPAVGQDESWRFVLKLLQFLLQSDSPRVCSPSQMLRRQGNLGGSVVFFAVKKVYIWNDLFNSVD
jgi:hypothetical protein